MQRVKEYAVSMAWLIGAYVVLYLPIHAIRWAIEDMAGYSYGF